MKFIKNRNDKNRNNKIKLAFKKIKIDIKSNKDSIEALKNNLNYSVNNENKDNLIREIDYLKNEIKFLKKIIYSMQTNNEIEFNDLNKKEIIGDKISLKVHYSNCPFLKKVSQENKVIFNNINSAIRKGYSKCFCIENEK